jgi:hypothetical protein
VHAPPAALQQRLAPTTSAQRRPPAQQLGAAPVVVQATDSPRVHGAARQVPDWQVKPEQHSEFAAQVAPSEPQQRPAVQRRPPQQPVSLAQAPPALLQQRDAPETSPQLRPLAQHAVVEPAMHAAPSVSAQPVGGRQVPDWQVSPSQQSALDAQVCAELRQAQRPAVQIMAPQHSVLLVHVAAASRQQSDAVGDARHESPAQQVAIEVHARPAAVHAPVVGMQVPDWHVSPVPQAAPVVQHGPPLAPQAAAMQAPAAQRTPASQALLQRPQLRASPAGSTHDPAQHARPAPLQVLPAQHASPRVPQAVLDRAQTPLWQVSPASHIDPAQHISPSAPHAVRGAQVPAVQVNPSSQRSPAQHAWASPPHGGMASQRPLAQRNPLAQAFSAQHISPAPPHDTGGAQRPSRHTSPAAQEFPSQHACVSAPHRGDDTHAPPVHVSPCSHASPEQHDWPWVPQSGWGASAVNPASRPPPPSGRVPRAPSSGTPCAQPTTRAKRARKRRSRPERGIVGTPQGRRGRVARGRDP